MIGFRHLKVRVVHQYFYKLKWIKKLNSILQAFIPEEAKDNVILGHL